MPAAPTERSLRPSNGDVETAPLLNTVVEHDDNIVGWDGPDDPENPQNWSAGKKWVNIVLLSFMTFLTPFASSMFAPGIPQVMKDFGVDSTYLASFVVSVYVLGYAFGPLFIAPMSELYGRKALYLVTSFLFLLFSLMCAWSTSIWILTLGRFLAGLAGSCPITVGSGTIADTFVQQERGRVMGLWTFSILFGPSLGPVIGSYVAEGYGWRSNFYILAICTGVYLVLAMFFQDETFPPLLLEAKVRRLQKETGNKNLHSAWSATAKTPRELLLGSIVRPTKLLFLSPLVFGCSLYVAVGYGYMYLIFTTITKVFLDQYNFNRSAVGTVFLGLGVGQFISLAIFSRLSDPLLKRLAKGGQMKPEYRLPLLWPGAVLVPLGLIVYGWSAELKLHFMIPILGTALFGAGMIWTFLPIGIYLVDAFTIYAASATAASTVLRSIGGAFIPVVGGRLYEALGLGWGNTLLAAIAISMTPMILVFLKYGEVLREHPRFRVEL
ncbi:hypothetical protein F66182_1304 [Fusarium sp. NRRL 66182]|nr:hypothetical protein F66182_1304 [Fusarium sp. NRRL 66182]